MHPVSESLTMEKAAKEALWFGVLATNAGHHAAANCPAYDICHARPRSGLPLEAFGNRLVLDLQ